jgi:hypothetical protein
MVYLVLELKRILNLSVAASDCCKDAMALPRRSPYELCCTEGIASLLSSVRSSSMLNQLVSSCVNSVALVSALSFLILSGFLLVECVAAL